MKKQLLRDSIELLESVRLELLNSVENEEVIEKLDLVIHDLGLALEDSSIEISATDVLNALGTAVQYLPTVIKAVEAIANLIGN
jgi:hypothetical protein